MTEDQHSTKPGGRSRLAARYGHRIPALAHAARRVVLLCSVFSLLLSGCATRIRSEVTAFHQWPAHTVGQSFVFANADAQNLERQAYENLVRLQLLQLGLHEAAAGASAQLSVSMDYSIQGRDMRVVETVLVDSWYGTPWYGPGYYSPYWGSPGFGHPFYGPMWPSMPVAREVERRYRVFYRELKLKISDIGNQQPLYDVTVRSEGSEGNLTRLMPYLVQSAFTNFPGKSGVPHTIELKMQP